MKTLQPSSPFAQRFVAYLAERFPVGTYGLLTVFYVGGAWGLARNAGGDAVVRVPAVAYASLLVLLVFFHLRIFDEFKDYQRDKVNHPERLVSRGIITLPQLKTVGAVVLTTECVLALLLGWHAAAWWLATLMFSVLMRFEFFVPHLIEHRPFLYAITHQPIMLPIGALVYAAAGTPLTHLLATPLLLHQVLAVGGLFSFEVARKLRAPADEKPTDMTYSQVHGPVVAGLVAAMLLAISITAGVFLLGWWAATAFLFLAPFFLYAARPSRLHAKAVNAAVSVVVLGLHAALAVRLLGAA